MPKETCYDIRMEVGNIDWVTNKNYIEKIIFHITYSTIDVVEHDDERVSITVKIKVS